MSIVIKWVSFLQYLWKPYTHETHDRLDVYKTKCDMFYWSNSSDYGNIYANNCGYYHYYRIQCD
jgi:hypothetical protein